MTTTAPASTAPATTAPATTAPATTAPATTHRLDVIANEAPVMVPLPRTPGMNWPGSGETAFVPAALLLAGRGRCSCADCVDGFVHMMRRNQLRAV